MRSLHSFLIRVALAAALIFLVMSCGSYGPRTLEKDQLDYGRSVGDTWKNQMLSNLVKLRYADMPVFVDVGQIVSGYSLETAVSASLGFGAGLTGDDTQLVGASGKYTDRPTITYTPKTGEAYLSSLLKPVTPGALLSLVQAGYNPRLLFTWAVESINGVKNYRVRADVGRAADPRFAEFVDLLYELQRAGAIGFEIKEEPETRHTILLRFNDLDPSPEVSAMRQRAAEIIGVDASVREFRIVYSAHAEPGDVIAIQTRSVLQMLQAMSGFVDVPADKASRAAGGFMLAEGEERPFHIHSGTDKPDDVFASYHYQGDWYWIEHDDIASKRVFTLMLFVTTLTSQTGEEIAPVLTIPTS